MTKPRDMDIFMAQNVLGHKTYYEKNGAVREKLASGQSRPLRAYSTEIAAAWEIVEKIGITLLPVDQGWFALIGEKRSWTSPAEFLTYLQTADFANSGAAVGEQAPLTICLAAMKAIERRQIAAADWEQEGDELDDEPQLPN